MTDAPFEEVKYGYHYKYWTCPMNLIPKSVFSFLSLYDWQKQFPASVMPSFSDTSVRFKKAVNFFSIKTGDYIEAMRKAGK